MNKHGIIIHPEELTDKMIVLLKESGINVLGLHPIGGTHSNEHLQRFIELMKTEEFQAKLKEIREAGIAVEYECHALSWLLPRSLYEKHPDWFRMDETGKRVNDFNICASNSEALEYLSERAAELVMLLKSDTGMYYLWADDVEHAYCNCEKCRDLSPSDQALLIYNAILKGIKRVDKDAKQCYLAYQKTLEPPTKVKPQDGIFVEFAPMHRDTLTPIYEISCEKNVWFCKWISPLIECFGNKDAQVLEYWLDNSLMSGWKKPPKEISVCTETISRDMKFYRECGFEHITTFGCYLSNDYMELYGTPPIVEYGRCFKC